MSQSAFSSAGSKAPGKLAKNLAHSAFLNVSLSDSYAHYISRFSALDLGVWLVQSPLWGDLSTASSRTSPGAQKVDLAPFSRHTVSPFSSVATPLPQRCAGEFGSLFSKPGRCCPHSSHSVFLALPSRLPPPISGGGGHLTNRNEAWNKPGVAIPPPEASLRLF